MNLSMRKIQVVYDLILVKESCCKKPAALHQFMIDMSEGFL